MSRFFGGRSGDSAAARPAPASPLPEMVDVVFELAGDRLPGGHEWPLYEAIRRAAPWIEETPHAGVHPIRGERAPDGSVLLARRAKLVVRMPLERVCAASVLEGAILELGTTSLHLGRGTFRKLAFAPTLYSPRVATGDAEESAFMARIADELAVLGIPRPFLCGRRVTVALARRMQPAFSVAVHHLTEPESLRLQSAGLGTAHSVGCGLFVPHKTIVAVQ